MSKQFDNYTTTGIPTSATQLYKLLGAAITHFRLKRNLSQQQLADLSTLDRTTLINVEKGHIGPAAKTLVLLSQALHIPLYKFFTQAMKGGESK